MNFLTIESQIIWVHLLLFMDGLTTVRVAQWRNKVEIIKKKHKILTKFSKVFIYGGKNLEKGLSPKICNLVGYPYKKFGTPEQSAVGCGTFIRNAVGVKFYPFLWIFENISYMEVKILKKGSLQKIVI